MAAGNNRNLLVKSLFAIVSMVVAYFSIVSTITICRVGAMERIVNERAEQVRCNERNIAVLLEKATTIEQVVRGIREDLADLKSSPWPGRSGRPPP